MRTVNVEPPVTDEVLLVEDGSVGTEEAVGDQVTLSVSQSTEMEHLTLCSWVSILATLHLNTSDQ